MHSLKPLFLVPLIGLSACDMAPVPVSGPALVTEAPTQALLQQRMSDVFPACLQFAQSKTAPNEADLIAIGYTRQDTAGLPTYRQVFDDTQEPGQTNEVAVVFNDRFGVCGVNLPEDVADLEGFSEWISAKMQAEGYSPVKTDRDMSQTFVRGDSAIGVERVVSRGVVTVTMYPTAVPSTEA